MKRVLLTGGTGFVGANLARRLLRDGHAVHLLVRPAHAGWRIEEIRHDIQLHELELADANAASKTVAAIKPDWIFHLAAHGAYSWQKDAAQIFQTNLIATVNLLESALRLGFEAFVHTGSSSEYGFKDHAPAETEWVEPNSHYACAKAAATQYCRYSAQAQKAHIVTLRLYSAFGPFEDPNRLMPKLIEHGLRGELPLLVNPDIARDYIYIDDVCEACILAAQMPSCEPGPVYNLGTGVQTSLRDVVDVSRRLLDIAAEPQWGSMLPRIWDTSVWVANNQRIKAELGWKPRFNFEEGFLEMANWARKNLP
ncbi:MAG: hypothetical protein QOD99_39 [Chthoniobacter sp.]|jgi:dolichol-phosphate mannosyltransferase|nr:hypothetical protein [Chthoniobacter sp.]